MRAALFDPYLDTLGGGERYVMTVGYILKKNGWDVDVLWSNGQIRNKLEKRLGLVLSGIKFVPNIKKGRGYDLCFWLSDGSVPTLWASKNILHFQVPFRDVGGGSLFNRLKLRRIHAIVCNSDFTKKFIDKEYGVRSIVVYPPVDVESFSPGKKENIIISVGRFSQLLQAKRQDVLIDAFQKMADAGLKGWRLILAGGSNVGGEEYVEQLKEQAKDYPIEIIENPDFNQLKRLYGKAKIFWSASGFGIDEQKEPEKVEHFGISVVEAMAAGCVPVITDKGGHKEIIQSSQGALWDSSRVLQDSTFGIIRDEAKRKVMALNAQNKAQGFAQKRFENEILKLVS